MTGKFITRTGIYSVACGLLIFLFSGCKSDMQFKEESGTVSLIHNDQLVYSYQVETKSHHGEYPRANYIHPLNDLFGSTLTEDFPEDHLHQRGIYWTWHQLYLDGLSVADPWICENIAWKVDDVRHEVSGKTASMKAVVTWLIGEKQEPLVQELIEILYESKEDHYLLDFKINIESLREHVELGGSDDNKGYGGFSARLILSEDVSFFNGAGEVLPQNEQVQAGNWVGMRKIGENHADVVIMYHPESTANLQGWILRDKGSMQNPVWPGRERTIFSKGDHFEIKARLVVFRSKASRKDIEDIYQEYIE